MKSIKRKGFTLVELLIVIVVISILAAMMMMSSSEAISSSRATQITSNMRNLQTAALAYWADNMSKFNKTTPDTPSFQGSGNDKGIVDYLKDDDKSQLDSAAYDIDTTNGWCIKFDFSKAGLNGDTRLKAKIKARANSLGLVSSAASNASVYNNGSELFLRVR